ncbi:MAG: hypothetical protein ACLTK8_03335 [Paeniclostridium sp.]
MIEIINKELNNLNFDSYLRYILSKEENKSLGYISMSSDLYKLLFEDILRIDYSDKCTVKIDLDVEYVENGGVKIFCLYLKKDIAKRSNR